MEGGPKRDECKLKRCYERNRLEEELWKTAYEQLWPLVHRKFARQEAEPRQPIPDHAAAIAKGS